ncbi:MAG: protein kinase [Ruminococcus sp.]|nr:protein kinase [Ruminococcus sp.]
MLEIGSIVDGKYKILRVVGKGGMSVVYQAVNERANKIWAIKEVRKDGVQNFEVVKQNLIVETDLLKRFNHPNLPSIIDVIDGDGSFLIVMDYIEGNSLSKALEKGAQSQDDVIEWSKQLCDVLGYLHSRKPPIIYRDMKPANVMLKPDGNVSLIDFGTAREFKSSSVEDTTCLGTQGYAAPEQYGGHGQTDARTDIYCLGATMYHLVTGHNPCTPPYEMYPIRQWNPNLSSGLEEIITKCTQRNPDDRYQSCAELLYALDHYKDLDIENKRVQSIKWKVFLTSLILTVVLGIASVCFTVAGNSMQASTYDSLVTQGVNKQDEKMLKQAVEMEPDNIKAYNELLNIYKSDDLITPDEKNDLLNIESIHESELIAKDKAAFGNEFAYDLANLLMFGYSTDGLKEDSTHAGILMASKWLNKVIENSNDPKRVDRAKRLKVISDSYEKENDISGDTSFDVSEYFKALQELSSADIIRTDNIKVALLGYKFVANELATRNDVLYKNGISENNFYSLIDTLKASVDAVQADPKFSDQNTILRNSEIVNNITENLKQAKENGYGNVKPDMEGGDE